MTDVATIPLDGAAPRDSWLAALGAALGGMAISVAGALVAGPGAPVRIVAVPVILVAGVVAVVAALARFEAFVLGALVVRSSLDALGGAGRSLTEPATLLGGLFVVASVAWLVANRSRLHRPGPAAWAGLAFLGAAALSLLGAQNPGRGFVDLVRIAGAVLLLVVVEQLVRSDRQRRRLLLALAASAVIPLVVLTTQSLAGAAAAVGGDVSRFKGTFSHPNPLGAYLGFLAITALAVRRWAGRWQPLFTAMAVTCGAGLIATYARGAWLGAALGVLVVAARIDRSLLVKLAVVVVAVVALVPSVTDRLTDLTDERHLSGTAGNSLTWRFDYWGEVLDAADGPVTGIGLGMVATELESGVPPHNDFLRVFVETGALGLVAYAALVVSMVVVAWRCARHAPTRLGRAMGTAATGCVASFLWLSVSSNLISQVVVLWYLFAPLGAASAALAESERARLAVPA